MLYVINGNICSGKTTISTLLAKALGAQLFSIDQYRKDFNDDNTVSGEQIAVQALINDLQHCHKEAVLELTSANSLFETIIKSYYGIHHIIKLNCPKEVCIARHNQRMAKGYKQPPFPYKRAGIHNSIDAMAEKIDYFDADLEYDTTTQDPTFIVNHILKATR